MMAKNKTPKVGERVQFKADSLLGPTYGEGKVVAVDRLNAQARVRYWILFFPEHIWIDIEDIVGIW